ncbi:hypothetical protein [Flavihumibacter sp. UBA7668]|uniref:hypothetical protein n=1 Tax=Flavihumibacter sp. UBA7668 TaxID=1946542 RepID=UPI0025B97F5C|nr:hypothetical protein [Flavihumibacter sp. UBA7668]
MNELIIVAVLFVPVLILILLLRYSQNKSRKKREELMLLFLEHNYPNLKQKEKTLFWQTEQLLAVYPDAEQLILIRSTGPHPDAAVIDIKQISKINSFRETEELRQEGKQMRLDTVVVRMGLTITYQNKEEEFVFFDYNNDNTSILPEKEAEALQIKNYLLKLIQGA